MKLTTLKIITLLSFISACEQADRSAQLARIEKSSIDSKKLNYNFFTDKDVADIELALASSSFKYDDADDVHLLLESDQALYSFTPPDGIVVGYSAPHYYTNFNALECSEKSYRKSPYTLKEIMQEIRGRCKIDALQFCLKFKKEDQTNDEYYYSTSALLDLQIPCPKDSFENISLLINNGEETTSALDANIEVTNEKQISYISIHNDETCNSTQEEWIPLTSKSFNDRRLNWKNNHAFVSVRFKDVYGNVSECLTQSIKFEHNEISLLKVPKFIESVSLFENTFNKSFTVNIEGTTGVNFKDYRVTFDETGPESCNEGESFLPLEDIPIPEKTTTISAIQCDKFNNSSTVFSKTYLFDNAPPKAPILPESKFFSKPFSISFQNDLD